MNLTYPSDKDLVLYLVSPAGRVIELAGHNGGSGQNFTSTTFNQGASTSISAGNAPFNGTFRPESSLSVFSGLNGKGVWWLVVEDDGRAGTGKLVSWTLSLQGTSGRGAGIAPALVEDSPGLVSINPTPLALSASELASSPRAINPARTTAPADDVFNHFNAGQTDAIRVAPVAIVNAIFGTGQFGSEADLEALDILFQMSEDTLAA